MPSTKMRIKNIIIIASPRKIIESFITTRCAKRLARSASNKMEIKYNFSESIISTNKLLLLLRFILRKIILQLACHLDNIINKNNNRRVDGYADS